MICRLTPNKAIRAVLGEIKAFNGSFRGEASDLGPGIEQIKDLKARNSTRNLGAGLTGLRELRRLGIVQCDEVRV